MKFKGKKRVVRNGRRRSESRRLSADERRSQILTGAMEAFSQHGFYATTTNEIAKFLGISEALLFKHFPTKDALIRAIEDEVKVAMDAIFAVTLRMEPKSESLALAIAFNIMVLVDGHGLGERKRTLDRLAIFSLLGDGRFFRRTSEENLAPYFTFLERCLNDARKRGEVGTTGLDLINGLWFCHHLAGFLTLSDSSRAIAYAGRPGTRNLQALEFSLRGFGFTEASVEKYTDPVWLARAMRERLGIE